MIFLPLLFFSIALAPGTAESDPSTEGLMLKIRVDPGMTDFKIRNVSSFYMTVDPAEANYTVVVKKPPGYPAGILEAGHDPGGRAIRVSFMNGTVLDVPYYESPHVRVRDKIGSVGFLPPATPTRSALPSTRYASSRMQGPSWCRSAISAPTQSSQARQCRPSAPGRPRSSRPSRRRACRRTATG